MTITSDDFDLGLTSKTVTSGATTISSSFSITARDRQNGTAVYTGTVLFTFTGATVDPAYTFLGQDTLHFNICDRDIPQTAVPVVYNPNGFVVEGDGGSTTVEVTSRLTTDPSGYVVTNIALSDSAIKCDGLATPFYRNTSHYSFGSIGSALAGSFDTELLSFYCDTAESDDSTFTSNYNITATIANTGDTSSSEYNASNTQEIVLTRLDATPGLTIPIDNVTIAANGADRVWSVAFPSVVTSGVLRFAVTGSAGLENVYPVRTYHTSTTSRQRGATITATAVTGLSTPRTETITLTVDGSTTASGWGGVTATITVNVVAPPQLCSAYHTETGCPYKWTEVNSTYLCPTGCSADDCCALLPGLYTEQYQTANEDGQAGLLYASLRTQPTGNVVFSLSAPGSQLSVFLTGSFGSSITFTSTNWNTSQTLFTAANNDLVAEGLHYGYGRATVNTGSTADADYDALDPIDVPVAIEDNDIASIVVDPTTLTLSEGVSDTVTVQLGSQPTNSVTVLVADDSGAITASPSEVRFTASNWSTPITVTLTASEDAATCYTGDRAEVATFNVSSTDSTEYQSVEDANVNVTVTDTDPLCDYCYNYHSTPGCPSGWGAINTSSLCASNCTLAECCTQCDTGSYSTGGNASCTSADCSSYANAQNSTTVNATTPDEACECVAGHDGLPTTGCRLLYYCTDHHNAEGCPSGWGAINHSSVCEANCTHAECCESCDYGYYSVGGNDTCTFANCSSAYANSENSNATNASAVDEACVCADGYDGLPTTGCRLLYYCFDYHNTEGCFWGWGVINSSSVCETNCTDLECCETCDYGFYSPGGNSTCIDAQCSSLGYTTSTKLASATLAEACLTETYGCNSFRGWQYGKYQPLAVVVLVSIGVGVLVVIGFLLPAVQVLRNDWAYRDNRATFLVANVAMAALLIPAAFLMEGYSGRGHALNRHGTRAAMTSAAVFQVLGAVTFAGIGAAFLLVASALWATTVWVGSTGSDTTMAGLTLFTAAQVAARNVTNRSVNEPMSKGAQSTVVLASLAAAFGFMALLGSLVLTPC